MHGPLNVIFGWSFYWKLIHFSVRYINLVFQSVKEIMWIGVMHTSIVRVNSF